MREIPTRALKLKNIRDGLEEERRNAGDVRGFEYSRSWVTVEEARFLLEDIDRLERALRSYGAHQGACECSCGLQAEIDGVVLA